MCAQDGWVLFCCIKHVIACVLAWDNTTQWRGCCRNILVHPLTGNLWCQDHNYQCGDWIPQTAAVVHLFVNVAIYETFPHFRKRIYAILIHASWKPSSCFLSQNIWMFAFTAPSGGPVPMIIFEKKNRFINLNWWPFIFLPQFIGCFFNFIIMYTPIWLLLPLHCKKHYQITQFSCFLSLYIFFVSPSSI